MLWQARVISCGREWALNKPEEAYKELFLEGHLVEWVLVN